LKKVKQGDEVISKQCRSEAFEGLDAIRNHALPTGEEPAANDVQSKDRNSTKTMTVT
jgi:hypothetical protein